MKLGSMLLLVLGALPGCSQVPARDNGGATSSPSSMASGSAVATITEADVRRRIHIIADDSMMGRDTPSRGLELTAQYVADEFKRFGLKPGGENGTWFLRYPITQTSLDVAASHVGFMVGSEHAHAEFSDHAFIRGGAVPKASLRGKALLISAGPDSARLVNESRGRIVLFVGDFTNLRTSRSVNSLANSAARGGAIAFVAVSNRADGTFRQLVANQGRPRVSLGTEGAGSGGIPVIEVRASAVADVLAKAGIRLAELQAATGTVRSVDQLTLMVDMKATSSTVTAPNTIGILEGSDPVLKNQFIFLTAHMDHVGVGSPRAGSTDSIYNGADDDGSGTVGVIELAEAFTQREAPPKRSLVFMTVSGEEKGLWGSRWYSEHPTLPLEATVADLNMDMIGRNWKDTIVVIGKEHSDLGITLDRVNRAHPELGMTAIDDIWPDERFYFRSDHFNFARKGVPILFFFNGTHEDYHGPGDESDKIDAEKEARILKLVYYLAEDLANTPAKPAWKPESYREIVGSER